MKALMLVYSLAAYTLFLGVFLYAIAFVAGIGVPVTVNTPSSMGATAAAVTDLVLLGLFGIQHSGMARRGFKRWWIRIIPEPAERTTYVVFSSLVLALMMWQWQGLPGTVWEVRGALGSGILWALCALGWLVVLTSTFMINHFDLFGLRQAWHFVRGDRPEPLPFQTRFLYKVVRHPIMLGFVIAFWATPRMTAGHLLFAAVSTAYIVTALQLEERDLLRHFGERYRAYRGRVPMLLPLPLRRGGE